MGKVALITGAAGGIGAALTQAFKDVGYRVVATDVAVKNGPDDGEAMAIALTNGDFVPVDLDRLSADAEYRRDSLAALRRAVGEDDLSVLVNNAAVQHLGGLDAVTVDTWQSTLNVNLTAPLLLSQAFVSNLEAAAGSIVNISSIHRRLTKRGFVAYATSKAALAGLTRALAVDLGGRVRVNAIAPAATATPMLEAGFVARPELRAALDDAHPVGRIARPDEVARLAVFLASPEAGFMSGAVVDLDGAVGARLHDPD